MEKRFRELMDLIILQETTDGDHEFGALADNYDELSKLASIDPDSAMEIFREGTDFEFSILVGILTDITGVLETDEASRDIMQLAIARNSDDIMIDARAGFGIAFDKFYQEAMANNAKRNI